MPVVVIGFATRFALCGVICTALSGAAVAVTVPLMQSPVWTYMGAVLFGGWILVGLPLTWLRIYRWLEENAKR